jgi:hypothetical protein
MVVALLPRLYRPLAVKWVLALNATHFPANGFPFEIPYFLGAAARNAPASQLVPQLQKSCHCSPSAQRSWGSPDPTHQDCALGVE